jgi:ABC-type multidrug transport system ATPase subunit
LNADQPANDANRLHSPQPVTSIVVDDLGKRFNREWIFRHVALSFESGKCYAVVGPNGSGKSTFLQVLWGQMPPSSGSIRYHAEQGEIAIDQIYARIAIAAPYLDIIEEFTLKEQLHFHFKLRPPRSNASVDEIMDQMGLHHARNKYLSNFSSGMKQRVKLAMAFSVQADILFLDEPGTNLDSQSLTWYADQLQRVPTNTIILIASNQPHEYPSDAQKIDILRFK